ncbi:hypothetical protein EV191_1283 [Tamaricihabitans halophyticus]|uniref:Uncharacterized protein n=1 Tax=Tamaricihabitans halophyticus TaxID=1262583 RepID=A0A4R2PX56_9PSEU|nr:hypothetical protein EV191_1283 [Tamaricihabitans halophyticus]
MHYLGNLFMHIQSMATRLVPSADKLVAGAHATEELRMQGKQRVQRVPPRRPRRFRTRRELVRGDTSADQTVAVPEVIDIRSASEDTLAGIEPVIAE